VNEARIALADRYGAASGTLYLTGTQSLVLLLLLQARLDARRGLATGGYVTGYRGSPLGGYDQQLDRARSHLDSAGVVFQPGLNEDLAATAVWGTQQAALRGEGRVSGVFSIWYGKGPGVDRSGDALRHGNLAGSAAQGGVLVLMGDDHTCESSTTAHQSEFALVDAMIPVLNPAGLQELVEYGLLGWEMSRRSGCWVGLKCVKDVVDVTGVVAVPEDTMARLAALPAHDAALNIRLVDTPLAQEQRLHTKKLPAAQAFAREQGIDRILAKPTGARIGIVTAGKSYLDALAALDAAGLRTGGVLRDDVALLKLGMVWPVDPDIVHRFAEGLDTIVVIEEKRALVETQVKEILFNARTGARVIGKHALDGGELLPSYGALSRLHIDRALAAAGLIARSVAAAPAAALLDKAAAIAVIERKPYFCAGCPHSTSTVVPEGSRAYAGIGCSYMAQWMDRDTQGFTQMGGEGANWIGEAPFSKRGHIFQNMGDGTYLHSGMLAIRAAVAAKTHMTFKLLFNDAVAMTGGQRHDGILSPGAIAAQVLAEGASKVVITSDDPQRTRESSRIPPEVAVVERSAILDVQRELRDTPGVSVLIHDQVCAAEKRRRRKRGTMPAPVKRVFINRDVCEGCGDCGIQSNCVAVKPVATPMGSKREIDQSACNADYSCLKGFCPSFVTVKPGAGAAARSKPRDERWKQEPIPEPAAAALPCALMVTGVGGTGIVTISAIVGMAAYLEGLHFTSLDMAGLAQKGGEVAAHLRIAASASQLTSPRVDAADADGVIAGDLVMAASARMLEKIRPGATRLVVNDDEIPTGDFTRDPDLRFPKLALKARLETVAGAGRCDFVDAAFLAREYLGDAIATNVVLLGFAFQRGILPLGAASIEKAIAENGTALELNLAAFRLGRLAAHNPAALQRSVSAAPVEAMSVDACARHLEAYQGARLATGYRAFVSGIEQLERELCGTSGPFTQAVARSLARLMSYKDEYEVARLYTLPAFADEIRAGFGDGASLTYHLAPPVLSFLKDASGRPRKFAFGAWMKGPFRVLAALRWLRGTPFDPFGYGAERKRERAAIAVYKDRVRQLMARLDASNRDAAIAVLGYADQIRGYGPVKDQSFARAEASFRERMAGFEAALRAPPQPAPRERSEAA
jgi:indolepyruvate ferredoxin oxidoreductase